MAIIREASLAPLTEPIFCPEVFATGFLVQTISTSCVRLIFFTDSDHDRTVVAKIIRPIPMLVAPEKLLPMATTIIQGLH